MVQSAVLYLPVDLRDTGLIYHVKGFEIQVLVLYSKINLFQNVEFLPNMVRYTQASTWYFHNVSTQLSTKLYVN